MSVRSCSVMIAGCVGLFLAPPALADISIGATPAFIDITLDAGKTSAQTILLFNSSPNDVKVKAYAWDWWHEEGNPRKFAPPNTLPHSAAKWISFVPEEIIVSPKKAANVTVVFNTPADAKAGNYAVAWFEAAPRIDPTKKELAVGARLGVLIMTAVRNASNPKVTVENLEISPPSESELLQANLVLVNSGDVHVFPKGTLVIMNKENKLMGHVGFERVRLLPGQKSPTTVKWGGELPPGEYQAVLTIDYGDAGAAVTTKKFTVPGKAKEGASTPTKRGEGPAKAGSKP